MLWLRLTSGNQSVEYGAAGKSGGGAPLLLAREKVHWGVGHAQIWGVLLVLGLFATGCPLSQDPRVGYVGTSTCLGCHNGFSAPDVSEYRASTHFAEGVGCEDCHGPGAVHVRLAGRGGLAIVNPQEGGYAVSYGACAACHADTVGQFLRSGHAEQQLLTCYDCHTLHRENAWYLPFEDNRICLSCHGKTDFPDDAAVVAHTFHKNKPTAKSSLCVGCHMTPLSRGPGQADGHFDHSLIPREPVFSNLAIEAGVSPAPANTCGGVNGCHDGSNDEAPLFDIDNPLINNVLQRQYEQRYGGNDDKRFTRDVLRRMLGAS